jgi:hypothetical protein
MKITLNEEQSKLFCEMLLPELLRIEKERSAKESEGGKRK